MHFVIFGLSISSSWGNGHATIWRGLLKGMAAAGHTATFYERDVPYYASARDVWECPFGIRLRLYRSMDEIQAEAAAEINCADVAMCTSYCPDGIAASRLILDSHAAVRAFYDLDTPITLDALQAGTPVPYLPPEGLSGFDLVLSYTGGRALDEFRSRLGARLVVPLYGAVDPDLHTPSPPREEFPSALCYLGTYAEDRQTALEELFVRPAMERPDLRFVLGGAQYPHDFPWTANMFFVRPLPPSLHPAFFSSGRLTLNVTRRAMAEYGFCPSGRLFEAAACGTPILTDWWEGLDAFFKPGREILRVNTAADVLRALELPDGELGRIAAAARERTLREHTARQRAAQLAAVCERVARGPATTGPDRLRSQDIHVGSHSSSRRGKPDSAACVFEGTVAGRQSRGEWRGTPGAVSEYLVERMIAGGAHKLCLSSGRAKPTFSGTTVRGSGRRCRLRGAAQSGRIVRCHVSLLAPGAAGRTGGDRPARHHLVSFGCAQRTSR